MLLLLDQLGGIWEIIFWMMLPKSAPNGVEEESLTWLSQIVRDSRSSRESFASRAAGFKYPEIHPNGQVGCSLSTGPLIFRQEPPSGSQGCVPGRHDAGCAPRRRPVNVPAIVIHRQEVRPMNAASAVGAPLQSTIARLR
jgi:hypothetical protein